MFLRAVISKCRLPIFLTEKKPRFHVTNVNYLLSETHPVGKSKARFFRSLGFDEKSVIELEQGLLEIAQVGELVDTIESPFGTKYVVDGFLRTPRGISVWIRTIWIMEAPYQAPRFVTAYPIERGKVRNDSGT